MTATTTSRPMTCRFRWASALSSPVRVVVVVAGAGVEGRQPLQPGVVVAVQPRLVVVDEDRGGDVHGVDQAEPLADAALRAAPPPPAR